MAEQNVFMNPSLRELEPGSYLRGGIYAIINPQIGTNRNGGLYLKCLLRDASGEVAGRKWKMDGFDLEECRSTGFVRLDGEVVEFNGQPQINIHDIEPERVAESDLMRLLPHTKFDVDMMFNEVMSLLDSMSHPAMKALARRYTEDQELMTAFRRSPAAMVMHHAWVGGLLEHTWQLMRVANRTVECYVNESGQPKLNRDLVLMGLFLHDLGKTTELYWDKGFGYTTEGNLVGHIARGSLWLEECARDLDPPLPEDALAVLHNIILSHHGEPEYGALRPPMTPEAVLVSQLDNLDARIAMSLAAVDPAGEGRRVGGDPFTDRPSGTGARMYRHDPLPE